MIDYYAHLYFAWCAVHKEAMDMAIGAAIGLYIVCKNWEKWGVKK